MEKVRAVLAVLKRQYFWVLLGTLLLVGLGTWLTATAQIDAKFRLRSTALNNGFREVRDTNTSNHPNEVGIQKIQELHEKLGENVFKAWGTLYGVQYANNPLPDAVRSHEGFKE
jgi:hypothetical protein